MITEGSPPLKRSKSESEEIPEWVNPNPPPPKSFSERHQEHYQQIVDESFRNAQFVVETEFSDETKDRYKLILNQGIWLPEDFYRALSKCNDTIRKKQLEDQDGKRCKNGQVPWDNFLTCVDKDKKRIPFTFHIKENVHPSIALRTIDHTVTLLDSHAVYMLAFHRALAEFIGLIKYDCLCEGKLVLSNDHTRGLTRHLFKMIRIKEVSQIQAGDLVTFGNTLSYVSKHPFGNRDKISTMCVSKSPDTYVAFGEPPEALSQQQIEGALFRAFNQPPIIKTAGWLSKHQFTREDFDKTAGFHPKYNMRGKLHLIIYRPHLENIAKLAEATLENIKEVFQALQDT